MNGYLNPGSAFVGEVGVAVARALDGTHHDFSTASAYFKRLCKSDPAMPRRAPYAGVFIGLAAKHRRR
jgi:hypothetical protein